MPLAVADDPEFVSQLRAGRPEARSTLFLRHHRVVLGVLRRAFGSDPEVPDLVQEVFYRAFRDAKNYRGDCRGLDAWLRGIAQFTALGLIRHRAVRQRYAAHNGLDTDLQPMATVATPEQLEALRRVFEIFDRLPESERRPFALSLATDMTRDELARACGLSPSTLKRRLIRARTRFERLAARDPSLATRVVATQHRERADE